MTYSWSQACLFCEPAQLHIGLMRPKASGIREAHKCSRVCAWYDSGRPMILRLFLHDQFSMSSSFSHIMVWICECCWRVLLFWYTLSSRAEMRHSAFDILQVCSPGSLRSCLKPVGTAVSTAVVIVQRIRAATAWTIFHMCWPG